MKTDFLNESTRTGICELDTEEMRRTHGGSGIWLDLLLCCVSPGLAALHLGVKAGYAEAAG
jgi:hypothetical protein